MQVINLSLSQTWSPKIDIQIQIHSNFLMLEDMYNIVYCVEKLKLRVMHMQLHQHKCFYALGVGTC